VKKIMPAEVIEGKILLLRGRKVMLDADLAGLYGVETRVLNQAVRRNRERFPADFLVALTRVEIRNISQFVTCSAIKHSKNVFAFTEEGVAMLSGVLNSPRAVRVNIGIMRAFVRLRKILSHNKNPARRLDGLEKKYDRQFRIVFDAIREIIAPPAKPRKHIGFTAQEKRARYLSVPA